MADVEHYYQILDIQPGASAADLKQAYRRLVKDWHPDRFAGRPDAQAAAEERIKQINTAYAYLKDHPAVVDALPAVPPLDSPPEVLAQWYYDRGVMRAKQQDHQGAIADFGHAIALRPSYCDAYKYRGLVYSILGKDRKANADLRRVAQLRRPSAATPATPQTSPPQTTTAPRRSSPDWICAGILRSHSDAVSAIALSPDGRYLVSGSYDETLRIWQVGTGRQLRTLAGHTDRIHCVAISPDNRWIASGSSDRTIKIWNLQTGRLVRSLGNWLGGHREAVLSLCFHPDRKRLASGGADHTIRLWKLSSGKEQRCISSYSSAVTDVAISPDGKTLVSGSLGKDLKIRQILNGNLIHAVQDEHQILSLVFSPDGEMLATGGSDRMIRLWDVATGELAQAYPGHSESVTALAYSHQGHLLLSGSEDGSLKLWDAITGRELWQFQEHSDRISGVAFSPDAQTFASASFDQTIRIWWRSQP